MTITSIHVTGYPKVRKRTTAFSPSNKAIYRFSEIKSPTIPIKRAFKLVLLTKIRGNYLP
jgi:hypothetical protein